MCKSGSCADSKGRCIPNSDGEWIGEYAIRFTMPFKSDKPYLGLGRISSRSDAYPIPMESGLANMQYALQCPSSQTNRTWASEELALDQMHTQFRWRVDWRICNTLYNALQVR